MKTIQLTQGFAARVDDCDADLAARRWHVLKTGGGGHYARNKHLGRTILLHRVIMGRVLNRPLAPGEEVDHIDGDGLNNSRVNLRLADHAQNCANKRRYRNNRSGYKGVHHSARRNRWIATINVRGHRLHLGTFTEAEKAGEAYRQAAREHFGEFARF